MTKKTFFFCEPIKNNVINDGNFIRILYSTNNVVFNGIYLLITLNDLTCEKYYSKYKCIFNVSSHTNLINDIKTIEEDILKKYTIEEKIPQFKIYEQLKNGNFKIFSDISNKSVSSFIMKISGIWETHINYGLTYKFIKVD
jgi:uncharacterized CHY-type Zn-finger protein